MQPSNQHVLSKPLNLAMLQLLLVLFVLVASPSRAETITFVADLWPPFNDTPDSESEGYMVDVARAVFEPLGYTVEYSLMPWNRSIIESRKGRFNAIIGASKNDAGDFIFPEEELGRNKLSFYVHKNAKWQYEGINSLEDVYLGVINGYDYRDWFINYQQNHPSKIYVQHGNTPLRENIHLLLNGRIDAIVDNAAAIRYTAKSMGRLNDIKTAGMDTVGGVSYIYHAFSPNLPSSAQHAETLSKGIRKLRKSGELQRILDQYGIQDWQNK